VALSGFENAELPLGPGQPVVFLCASGNRTNLSAARLAAKAGDATAYVLQGGLSAWAQAGLPTEAGSGEASANGSSGRGWSLFRR
jgi:rhodanese-related sulfurtransferase